MVQERAPCAIRQLRLTLPAGVAEGKCEVFVTTSPRSALGNYSSCRMFKTRNMKEVKRKGDLLAGIGEMSAFEPTARATRASSPHPRQWGLSRVEAAEEDGNKTTPDQSNDLLNTVPFIHAM